MKNRVPPPLYAVVFAVAMWFVDSLFSGYRLENTVLSGFMLLFIAVGVLFDGIALAGFIRAKTTVNPLRPEKASELVVSGVYQYTRNPMYLGMLFLLCAWSCWLANPVAMLLLPLFVWLITYWQIKPEEQALTALFGADYEVYCQRVRRWL